MHELTPNIYVWSKLCFLTNRLTRYVRRILTGEQKMYWCCIIQYCIPSIQNDRLYLQNFTAHKYRQTIATTRNRMF